MELIVEKISQIIKKENIYCNKDMSKEVSFKAGGVAKVMVIPENIAQLESLIRVLKDSQVDYFIMGNGSNFFVTDKGYKGVIIKIASESFKNINIVKWDESCEVEVGAGVLLSTLARVLIKEEVAGFEFASGIPGTIGGAIFMNAGAYGGEMKDIVASVQVMNPDGEINWLSNEEMNFSYRHSIVQKSGDIVLSCKLHMKKGKKEEISELVNDLMKRRNEKQPVNYPSGGSFFKRPTGYYAGTLIQEAGLKGKRIGGAEVSKLHGGFIINVGGATATDILKLRDVCIDKVKEDFGVQLEPEVRILGEE